MKMLSLILLLVFFIPAWGQELTYSEWKSQHAVQSIQDLAAGALLVRLPTRNKTIEKLEELGRQSDAEKLRNAVNDKNVKIVMAFKKEYDFSPVYFFKSWYSDSIRKGNLKGVEFLTAEGDIVSPNIETYLVAAFGTTESDTAAYFRGYRQTVTEKGVEKKKTYYADKNMGIPALIIYSPEIIQLTAPFPYYVRTFESLPVKRSIPKTVKKMNNKLHYFYNQNRYK